MGSFLSTSIYAEFEALCQFKIHRYSLVNVCLFIFTLGRSGNLLLRAPEVQDRSTGRSLNALDDHLGDSHSLNRLAINRLAITSLVVLIHA